MPNNLPLVLGSLVGRQDDIAQVGDMLDRHRVVTLVGAPGMGKTRLGLEVARTSAPSFPSGVWLVALASLAQPELVGRAVATALAVPVTSDEGLVDQLIAHIGDQRLLYVFDNCEHVLDATAGLAAALLQACPNLAILATSQEALDVPGEHLWPVSGLGVPAAPTPATDSTDTPTSDIPTPTPDIAPSEALASAAVQLFDQRARAADPTFVLTPATVAPVVEICRRLDGIPLAIELAAARVATFAPSEIARRLDDRFNFLTGGKRTVLPRHQTLRAAVDWSYDLLVEPEQTLLRRLSVFTGGATLDAIEQVCTGDDLGADECLDVLTRLVARSLVVVNNTTTGHAFGGVHGGAKSPRVSRYRQLETVRFYGREHLTGAGEMTALATRHVRWCVALAEEAESSLAGPDRNVWMGRLDAENDNLRAAMAWSLDQGPTENALRLAGALALFWRYRGYFGEGLDWATRAVAVSEDGPRELRAKAVWSQALMAAMLGRWDVMQPAAQTAIDLWQEIGDPKGIARTLLLIGSVDYADLESAVTVPPLQQAIALSRQVGDWWCLAQALALCGATFGEMGDTASARPMLEESISVARTAGDDQCLAFGLVSLGLVAIGQGDYQSAETALREALNTPGGGAYEAAAARIALVEIAVATGDHDRARALLAAATDYSRSADSASTTCELRSAAGRLALAEGDLDSAGGAFAEAWSGAKLNGIVWTPARQGLAEVAVARGDATTATTLFSEALDAARISGHKARQADALHGLGDVARLGGDAPHAGALYRQALTIRLEIGDRPGLVASVEALAGVVAATGQPERAARALGSADAVRQAQSYVRSAHTRLRFEADVTLIREALGHERFTATWAEGSTMPIEAAVALLSKGRGARANRPLTGIAALTEAERQVGQLAADGLGNAEIAKRLFVAESTVKTHLTRVFTKLSVSSRSELASRYPTESFLSPDD